jgi:uncharacterized protein
MSDLPSPDLEPLSRTQILIAMGVTAVVLLVIAKLWLYFSDAHLTPIRYLPVDIAIGAGLGLGVTGLSAIVYRVWALYRASANTYLSLVIAPLRLPDVFWLGLLPALSEEILFRGVMLPAVGLDPIGILLTAACFGVLHMSSMSQWPYAVWATGVGVLFGFVYVETGNLLIPIIAHTVANWMSGLMWKLNLLQVKSAD